ncbi:helix-hairpin-helix domain-containing protein [Dethiothermospora halolimnae]|uniref:helix-hairpin-helix domain-containing protein n=1 Tax=Dethiothermospora halolimnae TaxID=3114390 RepID=UPI003CCC259C
MNFTKREQMVILILVTVIVSIVGYNIIRKDELVITTDNEMKEQEKSVEKEAKIEYNRDKSRDTIMVHISGAVVKPGLAVIKKGDRLIDGIKEVGGLIDNQADLDRINLARVLEDEEKIYIPKIGEESHNKLFITEEKDIDDKSSYNNSLKNDNKLINLNNGTKTQLMSLPGIGDVLADRIIRYRSETRFKHKNDLIKVEGIGDKKFQSIEKLITVN